MNDDLRDGARKVGSEHIYTQLFYSGKPFVNCLIIEVYICMLNIFMNKKLKNDNNGHENNNTDNNVHTRSPLQHIKSNRGQRGKSFSQLRN